NAATTAGGTVWIHEGIDPVGPEVDVGGSVVWNRFPFPIVLWHEAMGHAFLRRSHPEEPWNQAGGRGVDPTIREENNARNCLRLQGVQISDRVPTLWLETSMKKHY